MVYILWKESQQVYFLSLFLKPLLFNEIHTHISTHIMVTIALVLVKKSLLLKLVGHHRWCSAEEDEESEGSNYSEGEEGRHNVMKKRRSVVSDEDYQSSEDYEDDEDGRSIVIL